MKGRAAAVVAWMLWLLTLTGAFIDRDAWWVASVVATTVGAVLVSRRPENKVGWVLALIGPVTAIAGWGYLLTDQAGPLWLTIAGWWMGLAWAPLVGLIIILLLVFPDGRLLSSRWRWALWTVGAFVVLAIIGNGLLPVPEEEGGPNPVGIAGAEGVLRGVIDGAGLCGYLSLGAALTSIVVRYGRARHVERQQLKWFTAAGALVPVALVIGDLWDQRYQDYFLPVAMIAVSLAVGIAVMKYRLYEIDRIINRTIVYGAVTALLALTYLGSVTLLSGLARPLTVAQTWRWRLPPWG